MRISDWSSDVCSSDLGGGDGFARHLGDDPGQHLLVAEQREEGVVGVPIILHRDADMQPDRLDGGAAAGERLADRKSVVSGKSVSVRVDLGGRRILKKNNKTKL